MSVIQVRGTSGSGKTWVMRRAMYVMVHRTPVYREGRKRPLYYHEFHNGVAVLGSYEAVCGGCDTIGSAAKVYEEIQKLDYQLILCEGLLLSEDVKWSKQMKDLTCLYLTTPVEECIARIKARRVEAGNDKPLSEANTRNRVATIERSRVKLLEAGVPCRRVTCEQAVDILRRAICKIWKA